VEHAFAFSLSSQEELDLSAPNKSAMLVLPHEKKWQIYCSQKQAEAESQPENAARSAGGSEPEAYIERVKQLAMVRANERQTGENASGKDHPRGALSLWKEAKNVIGAAFNSLLESDFGHLASCRKPLRLPCPNRVIRRSILLRSFVSPRTRTR